MEENKKTIGELILSSIRKNIRQYTMVIALLSIWLIFTIITPNSVFLTPRNLSNLFLQSATIAILAIGMTLIIVTNNIDLSVGSMAGFTGAIAAILQVKYHVDPLLAILITLIVGLIMGAWQGYWVAYRKVPAFIVTLSSMLIFRGGILGVTGGKTISPLHNIFKAIGQNYIPAWNPGNIFELQKNGEPVINLISLILITIAIALFIVFDLRKRSSRIKYGFHVTPVNLQILKLVFVSASIGLAGYVVVIYKGIPLSLILVIILALIFNFIAKNTTFGRHLYAIGGNEEAAKLSGINIEMKIFALFILMGVLSSISGMVFTARLDAATAAAGDLFELEAIAATVIGGTSFSGGKGTIVGALIGALVMASLDNGMSLLNLEVVWQYVIKGLILLLAVAVDMITSKKS